MSPTNDPRLVPGWIVSGSFPERKSPAKWALKWESAGKMLGTSKKMVVWYCQMNISARSIGVYSTESGPGDNKYVSVCHGSILSLFVFGSLCLGVFEVRIYRGEGIPLGHLIDSPGQHCSRKKGIKYNCRSFM